VKAFQDILRDILGRRGKGMGKGQVHDKGVAAVGILAAAIEFFDLIGLDGG